MTDDRTEMTDEAQQAFSAGRAMGKTPTAREALELATGMPDAALKAVKNVAHEMGKLSQAAVGAAGVVGAFERAVQLAMGSQYRTANFSSPDLDLVFPKSTHDNPLRFLGRQMALLERRQVRVAKVPFLGPDGRLVNPARREKKALRRAVDAMSRKGALTSGRQWRRWLKAEQRRDNAAARATTEVRA